MDKVKVSYCVLRDCVMIKFDRPLPIRGERGRKLSVLIRKELIQRNIPIFNWIPIIFSSSIPKIEGEFELDISNVLRPQWQVLKERILSELNKVK